MPGRPSRIAAAHAVKLAARASRARVWSSDSSLDRVPSGQPSALCCSRAGSAALHRPRCIDDDVAPCPQGIDAVEPGQLRDLMQTGDCWAFLLGVQVPLSRLRPRSAGSRRADRVSRAQRGLASRPRPRAPARSRPRRDGRPRLPRPRPGPGQPRHRHGLQSHWETQAHHRAEEREPGNLRSTRPGAIP